MGLKAMISSAWNAIKTRKLLRLINAMREVAGYKPLDDLKRGVPSDVNRCPIARSLPGVCSVNGSSSIEFRVSEVARRFARLNPQFVSSIEDPMRWDYDDDKLVPTGSAVVHLKPEAASLVQQFVQAFDSGDLPQYEHPKPDSLTPVNFESASAF